MRQTSTYTQIVHTETHTLTQYIKHCHYIPQSCQKWKHSLSACDVTVMGWGGTDWACVDMCVCEWEREWQRECVFPKGKRSASKISMHIGVALSDSLSVDNSRMLSFGPAARCKLHGAAARAHRACSRWRHNYTRLPQPAASIPPGPLLRLSEAIHPIHPDLLSLLHQQTSTVFWKKPSP